MPTLEERVTLLEQQLSALEDTALADTISPNYLTVNPDGTVSATFSGIIKAAGVSLPEAPNYSTPLDENRVAWTRADGALNQFGDPPASLYAGEGQVSSGDAADIVSLVANSVGLSTAAQAQVAAFTGNLTAELNAIADQGHGASVQASAQPGGGQLTILDSAGNSNFVQIYGAAKKLRLAVGQVAVGWAGGSISSRISVVNTGLPVAATAVALSAFTSVAGYASYGGFTGSVAGSFSAYAVASAAPPAGDTTTLTWIAIG